jgi:signal transduction histidine kinase
MRSCMPRGPAPHIAGEDLPHVVERSYRGDESRARTSRGARLGMSIDRGKEELEEG